MSRASMELPVTDDRASLAMGNRGRNLVLVLLLEREKGRGDLMIPHPPVILLTFAFLSPSRFPPAKLKSFERRDGGAGEGRETFSKGSLPSPA